MSFNMICLQHNYGSGRRNCSVMQFYRPKLVKEQPRQANYQLITQLILEILKFKLETPKASDINNENETENCQEKQKRSARSLQFLHAIRMIIRIRLQMPKAKLRLSSNDKCK